MFVPLFRHADMRHSFSLSFFSFSSTLLRLRQPSLSLTPFLRPSFFPPYPFLFLLSRFLFGATTHTYTHALLSPPATTTFTTTTISYLFLSFFPLLRNDHRGTDHRKRREEDIFLVSLYESFAQNAQRSSTICTCALTTIVRELDCTTHKQNTTTM